MNRLITAGTETAWRNTPRRVVQKDDLRRVHNTTLVECNVTQRNKRKLALLSEHVASRNERK